MARIVLQVSLQPWPLSDQRLMRNFGAFFADGDEAPLFVLAELL
jgi:hypothetical protein